MKYTIQSREALAVILRKQAQDERRAEWIKASEQRARLLQQASLRYGIMPVYADAVARLLSHEQSAWEGDRAVLA